LPAPRRDKERARLVLGERRVVRAAMAA